MNLVLLVYGKLLAEQIVPLFVDAIVVPFIGTRIYWTKLAIPDLLYVRFETSELPQLEEYSPEPSSHA